MGFESFNVHRIEAGIPWYGLDIEENTLPIEAGLEKTRSVSTRVVTLDRNRWRASPIAAT